MDLTARVSRALRSIDGVIVIVDAVEGCQIQTEVVTKQALEDRVKPILFINKVDRLIKELKLSPEQIEKQFENIINKFNDFIDIYAETEFKDEWKIYPERNNVGFGCALNPSWGFTINLMVKNKLKFKNIIDFYLKNNSSNIKALNELLPLDSCILDMIINHLPSPKKAQSYRIKKIWNGDMETEIANNLISCNEKGIGVICIHKVLFEKNLGKIAVGRIFSGTISVGDEIYLLNEEKINRIQQIFVYMGHKKEIIKSLTSGNIGAFIGLSDVRVGETLTEIKAKDLVVPFENIKYITQPVITVSIEPERPQELPKMLEILKIIKINDPDIFIDINEDTGEYLISGIGQLHLEIIANEIEDLGVKILMSNPIVVYREGIEAESPIVTLKNQDETSSIQIMLVPISQKNENKINGKKILFMDPNDNMIINNCQEELQKNTLKLIIKGLKMALNAGPLCEEPIMGVQIILNSVKIDEYSLKSDPMQIILMSKRAVYNAFLRAQPTIFEPIYKIQIQVPNNLIGAINSILAQRKGKILNVEQKVSNSIITGLIPVKESFDLASSLRSKTAGQAFWQTVFSHWEHIPHENAQKIIIEIRKKKGRKPEIPKPDFFK